MIPSARPLLMDMWRDYTDMPSGNIAAWVMVTIAIGFTFFSTSFKRSQFPLVNAPAWWQFRAQKQYEYLQDGLNILRESREKFKGKPFRILTELGEMIVLPPDSAEAVKSSSDPSGLNFRLAILDDFHTHLRPFETFSFINHKAEVLQKVVRKQLTKQLNVVTAPLSSECTHAVGITFGDSTEWKEIAIKNSLLDIVARMSSRVFLGDELCRNEEWLAITKSYTITAFKAAAKLNMLPSLFRPFACVFDPDCKQSLESIKAARRLINGVISKRRQLASSDVKLGSEELNFDDALVWAESESAGEPYDPATFQLTLSFAAIHTTTNLLSQTLMMLAQSTEFLAPIREEVIGVLQAEGWKKSALYNMKLLDSAIKETQRLMPNQVCMIPRLTRILDDNGLPFDVVSMRRLAANDVRLTDNVVIRKGERTVVDAYNLWNPEIYPNPEKFDIFRFRNIREQPGCENKAQLVSTSSEHTVFGHGPFACPGRFFAANEIKIALCHLILKYDWKLAPGSTAKPLIKGSAIAMDPDARLMFRRRKEELDLETLACE